MSTDQCQEASVQLSLQLQLQQTRNLKLDRYKRSKTAIHTYNYKYKYVHMHIKNGQEHRFKSQIKQEIVYSCLIYGSYFVHEIIKAENMSIPIFVYLDTYTSSRRIPVDPVTLSKS